MSRVFVWDLDGTLLDSRDAVRRAYLEAGVVMPDDAWGKPWQVWCGVSFALIAALLVFAGAV